MKVLVASSEKYAGCINESLIRHGHEVVAVASPMKGIYERQGYSARFWAYDLRGWDMLTLCRKRGIEFRVVRDLNDGSLKAFLRNNPADVLVVFGWPFLIPEETLANFPLGGINIHPSVLPKLRGPDPLFHILDKGADGFGVTFHKLTAELDAGPIYHQTPLVSLDGANYDQLYCRILDGIYDHLPKALAQLQTNPEGQPQVGEPSFVQRFRPRYRVLDTSRSAEDVWRRSLACDSHHRRITAAGGNLITFSSCRTMPYRDLVHKEPGSIQRVGVYSLEVNISGRYMTLNGVRVHGKRWWLSPLALLRVCTPGQVLGSAKEVRKLAKSAGLL